MAKTLDRVVGGLGVVLLNSMLVLGLLQVLQRYVGLPVAVYWTGEVSRTFLAFIALIALPYLFVHEADISFLPLLKNLVTNLNLLLLVRNVFLVLLSVLMVWSAYLAIGAASDTGLPTLRWFKLWWGYALSGVSFGFLLMYVLLDTRNRVQRIAGTGTGTGTGDTDV
jgi:TRAP-type C4-dicarboxylate transport system permease small subunit